MPDRSEEHTSELQSRLQLVCRLLLEKKKAHGRALVPGWAPGNIAGRQPSAGRRPDLRPHRQPARGRPRPSGRALAYNDTAATEIYTLSLHERSSDLRRRGAARERVDAGRADRVARDAG